MTAPVKLSAAQRRALKALADHRYHEGWMFCRPAPLPVMKRLRDLQLVEMRDDGARYAGYRITPAGRALLNEVDHARE